MLANSALMERAYGLVPLPRAGAYGVRRAEGGRLLMPPRLETYRLAPYAGT